MKLERLQELLGYHFGDRGILLQALTHTSYGHENLAEKPVALRNNERLEFLGDAILDLVITDMLLETYPNESEGQLSRIRAAVVNEKTLAEIARSLKLSECIRLGRGEEQSGGREKSSILSCCLEALFAAVYLDGGFLAVYPVVRHIFSPFFGSEDDPISFTDHKTRLQELVQARWKVTPVYELINSQGPDHAKVFTVQVVIRDQVCAQASGTSKKEAEQNAALQAIELMMEMEMSSCSVLPFPNPPETEL